jgi:chaperonin GroEL
MRDIWEQIWRARLVVADVSGANPNVNYELGLCHALGVPTILITKTIEDVPFDYRDRRCIIYNTNLALWKEELAERLEKTITAILAETKFDEDLPWPYDAGANVQVGTATVVVENPQEIMLRGISALQKVIGSAYGPSGKNVSVRAGHNVVSHKKGFAIASGFRSANPIEENGIEQMRLAAQEIGDRVGDGGKTTILLAHAILTDAYQAMTRGYPATQVFRGMDKAVKVVVSSLASQAKPADADRLFRIALTAAGDGRIARTVVEAMRQAGKDGIITVESSDSPEPSLSVLEGFRFDRGYLSETFVTDPETKECSLENCRLLICDRRISTLRQIVPILEEVAREKEPLLIIAEDVEGEALSTLVTNRLRGVIAVAAVKAPAIGDRRRDFLHDLAVLTGGRAITTEVGMDIEAARRTDLGVADKVVVTKANTTITGGRGDHIAIDSHVKSLRAEIDRATDPFEREKLQVRLTNLAGSVSTIRVGGLSPAEAEDQRYRTISAMHSAHAAVEEGCVDGGGAALLNAAGEVSGLSLTAEGEIAGAAVIAAALESPFCTLVASANKSPVQVLDEKRRLQSPSVGFDPESGRLADFARAGALDPIKLLRVAIEVAFTHARMILKTGAWSHSDLPAPKNES